MIYVVVVECSDYELYSHENLFASFSKEKSELFLQKYKEKNLIIKQAYETYHAWVKKEKIWQKYIVPFDASVWSPLNPEDPKWIKYNEDNAKGVVLQDLEIQNKIEKIAAQFNLEPSDVLSGRSDLEHLNYLIEEIPSDDDD